MIACYVAVILAVTARRSLVAPATLAVGTGAGIGLGAGAWGGMSTAGVPGGPGSGGGPPGPGPSPGPPDGGQPAGAGDEDILVFRVHGPEEDRTPDLVGATSAR